MKMDNRKTYSETEQEAVEEELRENEWQREWAVKSPMYIEKMNQLLQEGTKESREQLKNMFMDREFFDHYRQVDTFATMYVVMSIYELEVSAGICNTILEQGRSVEELLDYMFQLKMILYRLDFEIGQDTEKEFISFLRAHGVSTITINIAMTTMVMRPLQMALKLEKLFEKNKLEDHLLSMLCFIQKYWGKNYRVLKKLSDIYLKMGNEEAAGKCQAEISAILSELSGQKQEFFELQELLWKLFYKEKAVEKEIVYFLKKHSITDEVWESAMESINVSEKEYYLRILNTMFEEQITVKMEMTLQYALQKCPGDEMLLCLLAEIYAGQGDIEKALKCLASVNDPGELTQKFRNTCEGLKKRG